jgi:hypothetical protein
MRTVRARGLIMSGSVLLLLFVALLSPIQQASAKEFGPDRLRARIRPPLIFASIKIAYSGRTTRHDANLNSFQSAVIDALNKIDQECQDLLDQVIDAAESVSDGTTNVSIDGDNNVEVSTPSGTVAIEWNGTKLRVTANSSRTAEKIDCFQLLVQRRLRSIRRIGKVNTSRLVLYTESKDIAKILRQKLCLQ